MKTAKQSQSFSIKCIRIILWSLFCLIFSLLLSVCMLMHYKAVTQRGRLGAHMAKQKERKNMTRHKSGSLTLFCIYSRRCDLEWLAVLIRFQSILWVRRSWRVWRVVTFIWRLVLLYIYTRAFFIIFSLLHFWCFITFCLLFLFLFRYNSKYMYLWHTCIHTHIYPPHVHRCSPLTIWETNVENESVRMRFDCDFVYLNFFCVYTHMYAHSFRIPTFLRVFTQILSQFFLLWSGPTDYWNWM